MKILSPDCSWKMSITLNRLEYFDKILHKHWYWRHLVQEIAKWHLSFVEALPSAKFWKSENSPLLNWMEYFDKTFALTLILTRSSPRDCEMTFTSVEACWAPNSEKVKMALSPELSGVLWWKFAYTLILTWCSPWDSQMTFGIGRGFAEVQILKIVKFNS